MTFPLSFSGRIGRLPYFAQSVAVFFSQHLVAFLLAWIEGVSVAPTLGFAVQPLAWLAHISNAPDWILIVALAWILLAGWGLAALSYRRSVDAGITGWVATFAMAPAVQIPVILLACLMPSTTPATPTDKGLSVGWSTEAAVHGTLAGIGMMLFAVVLGALVFGTYGYGMFVVSPLMIGAMTGYFANRKIDVGAGGTAKLVTLAGVLGALFLVAFALEGMVCIVMALPLGIGVALLGGWLGRTIARIGKQSVTGTFSSISILPLVFFSETLMPPVLIFDTEQSIEVAAPRAAVWQAIIHMDRMDEPLALPFRLGVAYPISGDVIGQGIGALRHGEFSTGTAIERVTEWEPGRKLAFAITNAIPAMRELSPYEHVHAPHVVGYFRTNATSFELSDGTDGKIRIVERSSHELRLDPALYWLPFARLVIGENAARVLDHVRSQAERTVTAAG